MARHRISAWERRMELVLALCLKYGLDRADLLYLAERVAYEQRAAAKPYLDGRPVPKHKRVGSDGA